MLSRESTARSAIVFDWDRESQSISLPASWLTSPRDFRGRDSQGRLSRMHARSASRSRGGGDVFGNGRRSPPLRPVFAGPWGWTGPPPRPRIDHPGTSFIMLVVVCVRPGRYSPGSTPADNIIGRHRLGTDERWRSRYGRRLTGAIAAYLARIHAALLQFALLFRHLRHGVVRVLPSRRLSEFGPGLGCRPQGLSQAVVGRRRPGWPPDIVHATATHGLRSHRSCYPPSAGVRSMPLPCWGRRQARKAGRLLPCRWVCAIPHPSVITAGR